MVFLAIQGPHGNLYFHFVPCSVDIGRQPTADLSRSTPAAQLTTLALLALEGETQSLQWIRHALDDLQRWPSANMTKIKTPNLPSLPPPSGGDTDDEDEQGGSSRRPQEQSLAKRTREESPRRGSGAQPAPKDGGWQSTRTSLSALPYCTQACLLGLSHTGALDPNCPNTHLHVRQGSHYPISKAQLCSLFQSQHARNLDCGCEYLGKYGMFGRTGALLKITIPEYGYTLVAKGVEAGNKDVLVREAWFYSFGSSLQGIRIPVHLGNIELAVLYPLQSLVFVKYMMLMSWGGGRPLTSPRYQTA